MFAYHFTVGDCWLVCMSLIADLSKDPFTSEKARDYDPISIDLYIKDHPVLIFITKDQQSTADHKRRTPKHSYVDIPTHAAQSQPPILECITDSRNRSCPASSPDSYLRLIATLPEKAVISCQAAPFGSALGGLMAPVPTYEVPPAPPHSAQERLPQPAQLYSPPTPQLPGHPAAVRNPNRSLGPAFVSALPAPVIAVKKFDPMMATIKTAQGRQEAMPKFLNCCRLLTHHDPTMVLVGTKVGQPLATPANVFPRQPSQHFLHDVLGSLTLSPTGYIPSFYNYVDALLSRCGILVKSAYAKSFFTADRIRALFSIESLARSHQT
jgi:hypothetical protein